MARVDRTERLLNLVICLMASGSPVARSRIRTSVHGYGDASSDTAFERMFERDKDELRSMGVPVETVSDASGEILGYRIDREAYALPAEHWSLAERVALALAARTWSAAVEGPGLAQAKLEPLLDDPGALSMPPASITSSDAALFPLMRSVREKRPVSFDYLGAQDSHASRRVISPWSLVLTDGRWFLTGHDHDRVDQRTFRVSRIVGAIDNQTPMTSFVEPPADFSATPDDKVGDSSAAEALVIARHGQGARLRSAAIEGHEVQISEGQRGSLLRVRFHTSEELMSAILAAGPGAWVVEPAELRAEVVAVLTRLVSTHRVGGA